MWWQWLIPVSGDCSFCRYYSSSLHTCEQPGRISLRSPLLLYSLKGKWDGSRRNQSGRIVGSFGGGGALYDAFSTKLQTFSCWFDWELCDHSIFQLELCLAMFVLFSRRYYSLVVILLSAGIASLYYFTGLGDGLLHVHTVRSWLHKCSQKKKSQ